MKLAEDLFSEDKASTIAANPVTIAAPTTRPTTRTSRLTQRGIVIKEPMPQKQPAEENVSDEEDVLDGKGRKKLEKAPVEPSKDSTPSPLRRAKREAIKNKLREEAWLKKQRNLATGIGGLKPRSSYVSLKVEQ